MLTLPQSTSRPSLAQWAALWVLAPLVFLALQVQSTQAWAQQHTAEPQLNLPRTQIKAGMYLIDAQVASTPEQRSMGLMYRRDMPAQEGMLFVFEQATQQCFWMKNTLIPLTAAFVLDDGTIANLVDMKPQTTEPHCSVKPVRVVLEMNQGWFAKRGIKAGSKLSGGPFAQRN